MSRRESLGFLLVLGGAALLGLVPVFARWSYQDGLSPFGVLAWRYFLPGLASFYFLPRLWSAGRDCLAPLAVGALLGVVALCYFTSLAYLSIAATVLILFTYPMFVVLFGWAIFREPPSGRAVLAALLVLLATALVVAPELAAGQVSAIIFLAFGAPIAAALFILASSHWIADRAVAVRVPAVMIGAFGASIAILLASGNGLEMPSSSQGWIGVFGVATVCTLGVVLLMLGAPLAGSNRTAIAGTGELIVALIVGWVAFSEPVHMGQVLGGVAIVSAILLSVAGKRGENYDGAPGGKP